ncbi:MAG: septum formation inhibitor Maf [Deltaproteobacteria bacterium]|nr:septum formation inhibitor Maf [Deltaproteobacteria bacterium]MBW1872008.1 septum formation inhibitor Maf [Deltaproteobacteria bacterium]
MLVLASKSPRRHQLLTLAGVPFRSLPSHVGEHLIKGEKPEAFTRRAARNKADAVAKRVQPGTWILSADTTVVVDHEILGKPADQSDATRMLKLLSGREHRVLTAVVLLKAGSKSADEHLSETLVTFRTLDETMISGYLKTGESRDKAGAYGIQGKGALLVSSIEGSYTNVVGLPLVETSEMIRQVGLWSPFSEVQENKEINRENYSD